MKKFVVLMLAFVAITMTANAQTSQKKVLYKNTIRVLNTELDGSLTLRVTGFGRNRDDAKEQAMKNAVWAVIFDGIKYGNGYTNNTRPLVEETGAKEKYEEYFNIFFMDKGEYRNYVTLQDTKHRSKNKDKTQLGSGYEMTVRVLRSQLKARLKQDNVLR